MTRPCRSSASSRTASARARPSTTWASSTRSQGRWAGAEKAYDQALQIKREFKDRVGEGQTLGNLGVVYQRQGRWAEAEKAYDQALQIKREFKDRVGEGQTLNNLGLLWDAREDRAEALQWTRQAVDVLEGTEAASELAEARKNLARLEGGAPSRGERAAGLAGRTRRRLRRPRRTPTTAAGRRVAATRVSGPRPFAHRQPLAGNSEREDRLGSVRCASGYASVGDNVPQQEMDGETGMRWEPTPSEMRRGIRTSGPGSHPSPALAGQFAFLCRRRINPGGILTRIKGVMRAISGRGRHPQEPI